PCRQAAGAQQSSVTPIVAIRHAVAAPGAEQALALVEDARIERQHRAVLGVADDDGTAALLAGGIDGLLHHGRNAGGFHRQINALWHALLDLREHVARPIPPTPPPPPLRHST